MKNTYKLKNLDCANCAAKMERKIAKLPGVKSASISFMTSRLTIDTEAEMTDELLQKARGVCRQIEPDCDIAV